MIHNGDMFTHEDLFKSMEELTSMELPNFHEKNLILMFDQDHGLNLAHTTPEQYAIRLINLYDTVSSSRALDQQIKTKGFRTTFRFTYEYHLPESMRKRMVKDAYKLQWFYEVCMHPALPEKVAKEMEPMFDDAARLSYYYAQFIWAMNKNVVFDYPQRLKMYEDWEKTIHFLLGTGFEFHPKDVYKQVFDFSTSNSKEYDKQLYFKNWVEDNYGIDTGCLVLCDDHIEKLSRILTHTDTPYPLQLIQKYFRPLSK